MQTKKERGDFFCVYGRFLSSKTTITIATTIIRTNSPAIAGTKYISDTLAGSGVGATVASGAESTQNAD